MVAHPPGDVFAVMADPRNRPLWQENTERSDLLTEGPTGVGTRWSETTRGVGTYEARITGFEQDRLIVEEADTPAGRGRVTVRLEPDGEGATRLRMEVEIALRGSRRLLGPGLAPLISRQMPRDLDRLAELLDSRGAADR